MMKPSVAMKTGHTQRFPDVAVNLLTGVSKGFVPVFRAESSKVAFKD